MSWAGSSHHPRRGSRCRNFRALAAAAAFLLFYNAFVTAPAAATLLTLQVGMEGPQLALSTVEGVKKGFGDLQGEKYTVLVFWSSWVKKSEAVLARMQQLYARYGKDGLAVVGINVDGPKVTPEALDKVQEHRERLKITYPMLVDPGGAAFRDFGVIAMPTTVILDPSRIIRYELSGYPLVGGEKMVDFLTSSMEGTEAPTAAKIAYQPSKSALRFYNMGITSSKSKLLADKAESWFRKAAEADPGFLLPRLALGRIYGERGDSAKAQSEYQAVLAREPDHPVAKCELAALLSEQGKTREGLALLEPVRLAEESYAPCFYYSGYALGLDGKMPESLRMFQAAEKLDPSDHRVYLYQGKLAEHRQDWKGASAWFRRALEQIMEAP